MTKNKLTAEYTKKAYDSGVMRKYKNDYEFFRWFNKRSTFEDYRITYLCLKFHLNDIKFKNCLEVGPGAGTWTKFLLLRNPNANFTLVDISEKMLNQVKSVLNNSKLKFINSDFEKFKSESRFDFFFSSRAIEYMPNKRLIIKQIYSLLKNNSSGFIITKNPDFLSNKISKFLRLNNKIIHSEQIKSRDLIKLLKRQGFKNIKVYPCVISTTPLLRIYPLDRFVWKKLFKKKLNLFSKYFSESYIIKFKKLPWS